MQKCYVCGAPATRLCDAKVGNKTCDKPMCDKHAHHVDQDIDYCLGHYEEYIRSQEDGNETSSG